MTKHTKTCKELKSARLLFINTFIDYVCNRTFNAFLKVYKDIKKDERTNKEIQNAKEIEVIKQNNSDVKLTSEILDIIENNNLLYYCDLLDFLQNNHPKYFEYATKRVVLFTAYLESRQRVVRSNKE